MNKTEQAEQLRLAAEIIETGHPFEFHDGEEWIVAWNIPPLEAVSKGYLIRLTLATPPDGRPLHNPDDLTAEQVGAGWRLFLPEEVDCRHDGKCELWCDDEWLSEEIEGSEHGYTYRLPLSVPWPEAPKPEATTKTVPLGPDDVPPCSAVKGPSDSAKEYAIVCGVGNHGIILTDGRVVRFDYINSSGWRINRSIPLTGKWDANAWEPCSKEVQA